MTSKLPGEIDVGIEADGWRALEPASIAIRCRDAAAAELGDPRLQRTVSILFASDETVRVLNRDYRQKDRPTNVLSFPSDPVPGLPEAFQPLGDLALAYQTCLREADEKAVPPETHVSHLIVHGLLHLLGYDHISEEEAEIMEDLERRILEKLGIGDPYAEAPGH